jgi:sec-independent protein translocase protein TatA
LYLSQRKLFRTNITVFDRIKGVDTDAIHPQCGEEIMPFRFGPMELIIVLVVVLIIFGVGRLPEIGGAMGKALKEFRSTQKDITEDDSTTNKD